MSKVPFPDVPIGEFTVVRPFTAPGLFVYRYMQVQDLLHFPDYAGGDMTDEQRHEALRRAVELQRPLGALAIFLAVVALEDFIRDLGARLADIDGLASTFPRLASLRLQPRPGVPKRPFARLDRDPAPFLEFDRVNQLYVEVIGVEPIPNSELPRLLDLSLCRHTVAHYAAVFRSVDVPRFQYYAVTAGRLINPPVEFVTETSTYLFHVGRNFEETIRQKVFAKVMRGLPSGWEAAPPALITDLIELFNFFGNLLVNDKPPPPSHSHQDYEAWAREQGIRAKAQLMQLCIRQLEEGSVSPPPPIAEPSSS